MRSHVPSLDPRQGHVNFSRTCSRTSSSDACWKYRSARAAASVAVMALKRSGWMETGGRSGGSAAPDASGSVAVEAVVPAPSDMELPVLGDGDASAAPLLLRADEPPPLGADDRAAAAVPPTERAVPGCAADPAWSAPGPTAS